MDILPFFGLVISFAGSLFLAFSVKKNPGRAHQLTADGKKRYLTIIDSKMFRTGVILLALGILLQATPFLVKFFSISKDNLLKLSSTSLGLLLLLGLPTNLILAQSQSFVYSDSIDHYSFRLPNGWEEIPKSVIDQYMDELVRQTQGARIEYTAGFQLSTSDYHFEYPYILVQEHNVNTPSYSEIESAFYDNDFEGRVKEKTAEYSELISNATLDEPFIDKERHIIFMNVQSDLGNGQIVQGLTAMFLGKHSTTQMNFYAMSSEYSRWLPVFNSIVNSFAYEQAYAYDPVSAQQYDSPSIFEGVLEKALIGGILGSVFALAFAAVSRKKKPKT